MKTGRGRRFWLGLLPVVALLGLSSLAEAATRQLYIASTDGYVYMPDGRRVWIRGFVDWAGKTPAQAATLRGKATLPGPIIDVQQDDDVYVNFINVGNIAPAAPPDPHTIHLHGIATTTQNDGFPESSFEVPAPVPAVVGGPVPPPGPQNQCVYYFRAEDPGTYMYHCHVEASEHVQMGMYGALIIRPSNWNAAAPTVYGGANNDAYDTDPVTGRPLEYIVLLSDVDIAWHTAIERGLRGFNPVNFKPSYWLLNGRSFPDTIQPAGNGVGKNIGPGRLGDGPPTGLLTGSMQVATYNGGLVDVPAFDGRLAPNVPNGKRVLVRFISLMYQFNPMHQHGWHFRLVGQDARPLQVQPETMTLPIASGSTYDAILTPTGRGVGNYATASVLRQGTQTVLVPAVAASYPGQGTNIDVVWYPMHSHHDYTVTNNGIYPGGAISLIYAHP